MDVFAICDIEYADNSIIGIFSSKLAAFDAAVKYLVELRTYPEDAVFDWEDETEDAGYVVEIIDDNNYPVARWQRFTIDQIGEI